MMAAITSLLFTIGMSLFVVAVFGVIFTVPLRWEATELCFKIVFFGMMVMLLAALVSPT